MKRALALLVLLLAVPAWGGGLIVDSKQVSISTTALVGTRESAKRVTRMLLDIMKRVGYDSGYDLATQFQVMRVDAQDGVMASPRGRLFKPNGTFSWVIHVNPTMGNMGANQYRPDSIFMSASSNYNATRQGGPGVSQLVVFSDRGTASSYGLSTAACSTGVTDDTQLGSNDILHVPGKTRSWITAGAYIAPIAIDGAHVPSGGIRQLVQINSGGSMRQTGLGLVPINRAWYDSVSFSAKDSVSVWELPFANIPGAKHTVFAFVDGVGGTDDSLINADATVARTPAEVDPSVMLMGLARLDSLTGGLVFDKNKLPLKLAVTMDGAFMLTSNRAGPGLVPSDSSVFKATMDSIATLNATGGVQIKIVVGVNSDSLRAGAGYTSQLGWLRKLSGNVKFSAQPWKGVKTPLTTTAGDGNTGYRTVTGGPLDPEHYFSTDMLGFRRARFFYGGGLSETAFNSLDADTSIDALISHANTNMTAAGIKREERSRTLLLVI